MDMTTWSSETYAYSHCQQYICSSTRIGVLPFIRMTTTSPKEQTYNGCFFGLVLFAPYLFPVQFTASFSFHVNFAPFCCDLLIRLSRDLP